MRPSQLHNSNSTAPAQAQALQVSSALQEHFSLSLSLSDFIFVWLFLCLSYLCLSFSLSSHEEEMFSHLNSVLFSLSEQYSGCSWTFSLICRTWKTLYFPSLYTGVHIGHLEGPKTPGPPHIVFPFPLCQQGYIQVIWFRGVQNTPKIDLRQFKELLVLGMFWAYSTGGW